VPSISSLPEPTYVSAKPVFEAQSRRSNTFKTKAPSPTASPSLGARSRANSKGSDSLSTVTTPPSSPPIKPNSPKLPPDYKIYGTTRAVMNQAGFGSARPKTSSPASRSSQLDERWGPVNMGDSNGGGKKAILSSPIKWRILALNPNTVTLIQGSWLPSQGTKPANQPYIKPQP